MNKYISFLLALFATLGSMAIHANYYRDDTGVILRKITFGGYVREENQGWAQGIEISRTGKIIHFKRDSALDEWQETTLGKITKKVKSRLINHIKELPRNKIRFPDQPRCSDAPTTNYEAPQKSLTFAKEEDCIEGVMKNAYHAKSLAALLSAFDFLKP